jgi:nucleotide-binding universal stress UspA family protein
MTAANRSRRIVVGLDGVGTRGDPVLAAALEQARWRGADLCVVHALPVGLPAAGRPDGAEVHRRRLAERPAQIQVTTAALRDHLADHLDDGRLLSATHYDVRHGDPATVLLMAARQADLIVLGTRIPRAGGRRSPFLLGPVSQDVTLNAVCPVLLVPRP